jgi:hypothetical protein
MKKIKYILGILAAAFLLGSCEDYFTVELKDQANIDEIFRKSSTTHRYLSHLYSYLPLDEEIVGSEGWVVARSDESRYSWYQWVYYDLFKTGNYGSSTPVSEQYFNYWEKNYKAINQCSIFIDYVDNDQEDTELDKAAMKAEARTLRAFFYFCLFRQYGPVFVWGDRRPDEAIEPESIDRHTVDQNVKFMVEELDKAIAALPDDITSIGESADKWQGRITKGVAMAIKSRVTLYAASPLYNGCDLYKGKMKNHYGDYLFPQTADPTKWETAAQAAKDLIDYAEQNNRYALATVTGSGDPFKDGGASYEAVFQQPWNSETIFGWWRRTSSAYSWLQGGAILATSCPLIPDVIYQGYGGICPSLKLVDAYPMWETGRYPVKGYQGQNDYSKPIVDEASGYVKDGFTEGYKQPLDADWAPLFKAHNSTVGRDPRYYACLVPNGFYWPNKNEKVRFTCYDNAECTSRWSNEGNPTRVGYSWRKWYTPDKSLRLGTDYTSYKTVYNEIRLAEIYLNYAEACNEKPERNEADALKYLNKVRNRVGLNNIEEAYPEIYGNQQLLRWCIRQERMVELSMEALRHYDACRWMIAKEEYPTKNWTLHVCATNYEDSYQRVSSDFGQEVATPSFSDRDYLFPISVNQLSEMTNITQNYGF